MEILRDQFRDSLPLIKNNILNADIIAIDTEFPTLCVAPEDDSSPFDTLNDRYQKLKTTAKQSWPCQIGICTFRRIEEKKWVAQPYNFYIFPKQSKRPQACKPSNLKFLVEHHFDLNKMVAHGLEYQRMEDIDKVLNKRASDGNTWQTFLGHKTKVQLQGIIDAIKDGLDRGDTNFTVPCETPALRKNFFSQGLSKLFPGLYLDQDKQSTGINVRRNKRFNGKVLEWQQEEKALPQLSQQETQELLIDRLGITNLLLLILNGKKPLVGHNLIYDLFYLYEKLYQRLPDTFEEFRQTLLTNWPSIYDTKYIFEGLEPRSSSGLEHLFAKVNTKQPYKEAVEIFMDVSNGFTRYETEQNEHEAGYDAYITGVVLIKAIYAKMQQNESDSFQDTLAPYQYIINLGKHHLRSFEFPTMDIEGDENHEFFTHVYVLKFETKQTMNDVSEILMQHGDVEVFKVSSYEYQVKFHSYSGDGVSAMTGNFTVIPFRDRTRYIARKNIP